MKRLIVLSALTLMVSLFATSAIAQEYSIDLSYMSKYVWRGSVLAENGVLQPSLSAGMGNTSVNLWGNMDLTDDIMGTERQMNEWDYTVDYSTAFDAIGVSAGIIGYTFPNSDGYGTTEIYVGASYDMIGAPGVTIYQDIDQGNGTYVSLSGGYSVPVLDITSIDIGAALGYGSGEMNQFLYSDECGPGLSDFLLGVSATFGIGDMFSVTPSVNFSTILDSDGQDEYDREDPATGKEAVDYTNVFFGLTASAAF